MLKEKFIYNADAAELAGGAIAKSEAIETNEQKKLRLNDELKLLWEKMQTVTFGTPEAMTAAADVFKKQNEIAAVENKIKKDAAEAEAIEQRNKRVQLLTNLLELDRANIATQADKKATPEQKEAAKKAFDDAFEVVKTELLAKYATVAKTTNGEAKTTGERGATAKRIIEKFLAGRSAGKTDTENIKDIIASGESRGTTGAVVLAWQREHNEK